eukprot:GHUV01046118.1.p2 GENE.GHUV01046118.1~~GHUV01046118.1.p2  ORF type:complete len:100 (+),score=13.10 GHUV01046118.1:187-486(+)
MSALRLQTDVQADTQDAVLPYQHMSLLLTSHLSVLKTVWQRSFLAVRGLISNPLTLPHGPAGYPAARIVSVQTAGSSNTTSGWPFSCFQGCDRLAAFGN